MIEIDDIKRHFTRSDGSYLCARWGRPIAPVAFGIETDTLATLKGAIEAICHLAGHQMAETDPELGANLMMFFCRDWLELLEVPNLDQLVDGLEPLVQRLIEAEANQYRVFRFDEDGAICACFVFFRMDGELADVPAETLALQNAVQVVLLWSDTAFVGASPLANANGTIVLRPDIAGIIRAAYDPVMPAVAEDASHAIRLAARVPQPS